MMSTSPVTNLPAKPPLNWSSLIQFITSGLAVVLLLGTAVIIVVTTAAQFFTSSGSTSGSGSVDLTQSFMVAASLAFAGVLVIPSAWYSLRYLNRSNIEPIYRTERRNFGLILTLIVLVLVVGALFLGNWVVTDKRISWLLLPPLNILATGLPALWLVYVGTHGLLPSMPKRNWGVFATGLVLGPLIILILELLLLVGAGMLAILWIMLDPNLANQLNGLGFHLQNAAPNIDAILKVLLPFLFNPGVLFIGFAFISFLVPLIEETLKPLGVWLLAGQKITAAQGFGYGVISGAGFGLFENLGNTSGGGEAWALLAATRITTLLLHCFTAGLVGWALASAWSQRRYLRLGVIFAIAVLVHGLWNGMAILSLVPSLQGVANVSIPSNLQRLGSYATFGIVALGVLVLVFFIGINAVLRRSTLAMTPPPSPIDDDLAVTTPEELYQSAPVGESTLPSPDIYHSLPLHPDDNIHKPDSDPNHQNTGENPPTKTEKNP